VVKQMMINMNIFKIKKALSFCILIGFIICFSCNSNNKNNDIQNIGRTESIDTSQIEKQSGNEDNKSELSDSICFIVGNNVKLPYKEKIDFENVKYEISNCKNVKNLPCDFGEDIRYIPLIKKDGVSFVLYPVDCGDFPYRFFLLTIKDDRVISELYVEGVWFEESGDYDKEFTSFEIDTNYNIIVTTDWEGEDILESGGTKIYRVLDDGMIELVE